MSVVKQSWGWCQDAAASAVAVALHTIAAGHASVRTGSSTSRCAGLWLLLLLLLLLLLHFLHQVQVEHVMLCNGLMVSGLMLVYPRSPVSVTVVQAT